MKVTNMFILFMGVILLTSCGTFKYRASRSVKIQSLPYTDFYLANQKSDAYTDGYKKETGDLKAKKAKNIIEFLGSSDSEGNATLTLSTKKYKKGKKRIYAIKSGYEPQEFKLHQQFNTMVLLDILYPCAFFFDKYKVLNEKRINDIYLNRESQYDCYDYLLMAKEKGNVNKRKELLMLSIAQDYRNENGIKSIALMELAEIELAEGDSHQAFLFLKNIRDYDPEFDISEQMGQLQAQVNYRNQKTIEKQERLNRVLNTMTAVGSTLNAAGEMLGGTSSSSSYTSLSYTSSAQSASEKSSNNGNYQREYDRWAKRIESIYKSMTNTGADIMKDGKRKGIAGSYNSANYTLQKKQYAKAQLEMKNIRRKAASKGITINVSPWETTEIAPPAKFDEVP